MLSTPTSVAPGTGSSIYRRARGFTLVEVLVAMVVGLVVIGVVVGLFAGTSRNRGDLERSSRLMENAQYATDLLREEIQHAGYLGEVTFATATWVVPDTCETDATKLGFTGDDFLAPAFTLPVAVRGYRRDDTAMPACITNRKPGTAVLVLRRLGVTPAAIDTIAEHPHVQAPKCNDDSLVKRWVLSMTPGDFKMRNVSCKAGDLSPARPIVVRSYYVSGCYDCGKDTIPTLVRSDLVNGEFVVTPVVDGVDNLQVEYGFDADGDGNPDRFLEFPDAALGAAYADWNNVMAVRIYLLLRSTDTQPDYVDKTKSFNLGPAGYTDAANDGYRRTLVATTIRLNNPAGRRETP